MHRVTILATCAAVAGAIAVVPIGGFAAPAGQSPCMETALVTMADSGVQGQARLCTTDQGVRADIDASDLVAGNAYTVWFVYFDRPSQCATIPCQPPDTTGDNPPGVLGRLDSTVAGDTGEAHFGAEIRGFWPSTGSEVHIPMFTHGTANTEDNRARARQLLTPQVPGLGTPGLGITADGRQGFMHAVAMFDIP
jgi:hypothetical protein